MSFRAFCVFGIGGVEPAAVTLFDRAPPTPALAVPTDDLVARLFASDEVAWSAIPALIEEAPEAVSVDGGIATLVIVERSLPFSTDIRIRVFVSGPGGDGFVDGDASGSMISINGN